MIYAILKQTVSYKYLLIIIYTELHKAVEGVRS